MVLIPESKIEEIRERVDLVALVQRHGVGAEEIGSTRDSAHSMGRRRQASMFFPRAGASSASAARPAATPSPSSSASWGSLSSTPCATSRRTWASTSKPSRTPARSSASRSRRPRTSLPGTFKSGSWTRAAGEKARAYLGRTRPVPREPARLRAGLGAVRLVRVGRSHARTRTARLR